MIKQLQIPIEFKYFCFIINQLFEIEKKTNKLIEENSIGRNIQKLREYFENNIFSDELGLSYHSPLGESFNETRTDCEASIAGSSTENLLITEVIKPVIRVHQGDRTFIIQKAVVIVESQKATKGKKNG
ncbi:MAG: hypothetical protein AB7W47_03960 [Calditrichaceae bacterium]